MFLPAFILFYGLLFCCFSQNIYLCIVIFSLLLNMRSHPVWVCGLKRRWQTAFGTDGTSHPVWVCGLKHDNLSGMVTGVVSHPVWVCGLKLAGSSDNNSALNVTPCMGVWIETLMDWQRVSFALSHPVWVCGLKLCIFLNSIMRSLSHPVWVCGLKRCPCN